MTPNKLFENVVTAVIAGLIVYFLWFTISKGMIDPGKTEYTFSNGNVYGASGAQIMPAGEGLQKVFKSSEGTRWIGLSVVQDAVSDFLKLPALSTQYIWRT